jgi:N-acetylmuramoyl-L-alanine amidase
MSRLQRVKRRLVREAVQANVDDLTGALLRRRRRAAARGRRLRQLAALAVPVALVSLYFVASAFGLRLPTWPQTRAAAAAGVRAAGSQAALAPTPAIDPATLDRVRPISREVFPLPVRKIVLDPGHGGENTGALGPDGMMEKALTLDIATRLEELLRQQSFEVELTRREDSAISLEERAQFANRLQGVIFISIHLNWIDIREVRGVETYYLGQTDDPYLTELAANENRGSGYSLADFRQLLERVYVSARQDESNHLASDVQRSLYGALRRISPNLQDRGVKRAPFVVLTGTEMPAILAEVSCLSNEEEARLLKLPEYRDYIAEALFQGIHTYARRLTGGTEWGT